LAPGVVSRRDVTDGPELDVCRATAAQRACRPHRRDRTARPAPPGHDGLGHRSSPCRPAAPAPRVIGSQLLRWSHTAPAASTRTSPNALRRPERPRALPRRARPLGPLQLGTDPVAFDPRRQSNPGGAGCPAAAGCGTPGAGVDPELGRRLPRWGTETSLMLAIAPGRVDTAAAQVGATQPLKALMPRLAAHDVAAASPKWRPR
jgi:hypothetical protein